MGIEFHTNSFLSAIGSNFSAISEYPQDHFEPPSEINTVHDIYDEPVPEPVPVQPPVQVIYSTPQEAIEANGVPLVNGQSVGEFSVIDLPSGVPANPEDSGSEDLTVMGAAQRRCTLNTNWA